MKCLILAGGTGDTLWPLSRKNYPKQFMNIKEGRSLLQETVVRNMPFCDEFIIVTNASYKNIVDGQMKVFQSLKYRIVLEGSPRGTAAAIMLGTLFCNESELLFVVTSDNLMDGNEYKDTVLRAKELVKEGNIVAIGIRPEKNTSSYDYIKRCNEDVTAFADKNDIFEDRTYDSGYLWNSGMFIFRVGDFFNNIKKYYPELFASVRSAKKRVFAIRRTVKFSENMMKDIPAGTIEQLMFENKCCKKVVEAGFAWKDVGNVCDLEGVAGIDESEYVIKNNCEKVTVINAAEKQLVVTNDLENVIVVNTEDAVYVSSRERVDDIKDIVTDNKEKYEVYFDNNRLSYREWGIHELLNSSEGYKVKKVTVFPGMSMNLHQHELRSEHWSVVEGTATITLGTHTKDYHRFESVYVPVGVMHKVENKTDKNVVIIEVGIGEIISENDLVKIYSGENEAQNYASVQENPVVKLEPAFKDNLWGGTNLRTVFNKKCDYDIIAESWELSAHPDGQSTIASGKHKGMLFNEYLSMIGKEATGWKCQSQDRFPILIKFIDAKQALSIQIHPDDEFGLENEGEYGKNEMWYVVDCEPGAYLYCGLSREASKEELRQRIQDHTITEILNRIDVKKGDVVMVKAGTIHAIGAGVIICEIQQNSNSTYRMYDYDRRDKYGNLRELHIEKALAVADTNSYVKDNTCEVMIANNEHYSQERLVQCKYFECFKYEIVDEAKISVDESSFASFVFISGSGCISADEENELEFNAGDSFFVSAGRRVVNVKGKCTCIFTHV